MLHSLNLLSSMSNLWRTIAELCSELHPDRVSAIATGIEGLSGYEDLQRVRKRFGPNSGKELYGRLEHAWKYNASVSVLEVAAALRAASETASLHSAAEILELVWSGPSTGVIPIRHTEQVICELIDGAYVDLFLVSFVAYNVKRVLDALKAAITRGVDVRILMELSNEDGGALSFDSLGLIQKAIPTAEFYAWKKTGDQEKGSVHAKCAVADIKTAFVSSANLTGAAMEWNMEAGVLVKGGAMPIQLARHLKELITQGVIQRIEPKFVEPDVSIN